MREIKFRAWNKDEKIMCYENEDQSAGYLDGWIASGIQVINQTLNSDFIKQRYDFMQYTGLKDKNGKEIYEGDILEDEEVRIKVLYELDGFYGQIMKLKKVCGTEVGLKYHLSFFQDDGNDVEVIGNIYDNPELLKEE